MKVVKDLSRIFNSSIVQNYIKAWAKIFRFNTPTTKKEFIEFLLMDGIINIVLITIFILTQNSTFFWGNTPYEPYNKLIQLQLILNIAAVFPRISILIRRLRVRDLNPYLSFLIFVPLVGWVSTWIMGGRDKIIIKKRGLKKSEPKSLLYILTTLLVIIILVFLIILIIQLIIP